MAQTENSANRRKRRKLTSKELIIVISIFIFCTVAILCCYYIFRDDYKTMAENAAIYSGNAQISATDGIVSYKPDADGNITDEQMTAEDVLKGINNIATYLKSDSESSKEEKLAYLLNAGLVTKFPYIDGLAEDKVNGIVKFYRYSETEQAQDQEQEKYLLKFIDEEAFDQKIEAYETSGSLEVFNYFTIDKNKQLVIACRSETQKEITTTDPEVTVDVINKESTDTYTYNDGKYKAGQKTITKQSKDYQSIIEQYTMPFNLLAAFLVQTGDYNFVKELADMAYESEIHIGIYENTSITTKSDTYTYKKRIEYSPNTVLDFSKLHTTNPVVVEDTVNRKIIRSCIASMAESLENAENPTLQVTHEMTTMEGESGGTVDPAEVYTKFVQSYSGSQISALSSAGANFETKYWTRTESRTSLTIGTILADTWVARWEATYIAEPNEPTPGPTSSAPSNSERTIIQNGTSLFTGSATTEILGKLEEHSSKLKNNAVNSIIATTNVSAATPTMTAEMIRNQGYTCATCEAELDAAFPGLPGEEGSNPWRDSSKLSDNALVERVKTYENLAHTRQHINTKLQNEREQNLGKAQENFEKELKAEIGYDQYPTVAKSYTSISVTPTYEKTSVTHKQQTPERTKDGEKFKKIFNNSEFHKARQAILERIQWFWEYVREYDDTAKFENILRYLLNIATDSNKFGVFSDEEIENLFKVFEPRELQYTILAGTVSPFGCNMEREEFINAALDYSKNEEYQRNLAAIAGEFYDICTSAEYNVNPGLAFAWAIKETGGGKDRNIPDNNLFGMGVYNGQNSGKRYSSRADSIRDFCQWVVNNVDSGETLARAQEFATVNSKLQGTAENNIYVLFCRYFYLGTIHYADEPDFNNPAGEEYYLKNGSNWGQGGRVYIYHMYELGGIYEGEYAERCGHPNASDPTSLEEQADYVVYEVNKRITITRDVFGNSIFAGGEGAYEEINDQDRFGIYTSTFGRTYTEWKQDSSTSYGSLELFGSGSTMANRGCGVHCCAMLLNSAGLETKELTPTPLEAWEAYKKAGDCDYIETMEIVMRDNRISGTVKTVSSLESFIQALQSGYGVMSWFHAGEYTSNVHWMVTADIRETQLGSGSGYDVYILSSTHRSTAEYGWQPIEKIINNVTTWGYYIEN